jgi:hypothetical protein
MGATSGTSSHTSSRGAFNGVGRPLPGSLLCRPSRFRLEAFRDLVEDLVAQGTRLATASPSTTWRTAASVRPGPRPGSRSRTPTWGLVEAVRLAGCQWPVRRGAYFVYDDPRGAEFDPENSVGAAATQ